MRALLLDALTGRFLGIQILESTSQPAWQKVMSLFYKHSASFVSSSLPLHHTYGSPDASGTAAAAAEILTHCLYDALPISYGVPRVAGAPALDNMSKSLEDAKLANTMLVMRWCS